VTAACEPTSYAAVAVRLQGKALGDRVPISGTFDLTARCNLRCGHCYVANRRSSGGALADLPTERVLAVLEQAAEAGCLWLGLTGGEPLLRSDFAEIYSRARRLGFLVTVLTNGTLVTPALAARFADLPPCSIDVTLYGFTSDTYRHVTGFAEARDAAFRGVDLLLGRGVRVALKTTLSTINEAELESLRRHAAAVGLRLRVDGLLHGALDGTPLEQGLRLPPERAARVHLDDEAARDGWREQDRRVREGGNDRLFACAAGRGAFHVDSGGRLTPCLMVREPAFDLGRGAFLDGWNGVIREAVERPRSDSSPCRGCADAGFCEVCPGWSAVESGDPEARVDHLCRVARERASVLAA